MRGTLTAGIVVALLLAGNAAAAVKVVKGPGSVRQGKIATTTVTVSPKASCTITVRYKSGVSSASGLGRKTGTRLTWSWRVGSNTATGRWPVTVDCGKSGVVRMLLRVTR